MLSVNHQYGFFSFCSRLLEEIILYFNKHQGLPEGIYTRDNLTWYKPQYKWNESIFNDYFQENRNSSIVYTTPVEFSNDVQYSDFKSLEYNKLIPFIIKYFTPTSEIMHYVSEIETKYSLNDYDNICCLFYRGNDKASETNLAPYEDFVNIGKIILERQPNIKFLIQSDEIEFLVRMIHEFPNHILLHDYIRYISKCGSQVDKLNIGNDSNYIFSKYFVAITCIMSKCKYVICNSGNCALWITFFRGHAKGVLQYKDNIWV
jgi:hypothetical protein